MPWYRAHGRDLPWRRTRDPYAIWVAEAMLQQTTVAAATPYYVRFLERFPDVHALAEASIDDVLAAWSGLGYYRRARHLKAAAETLVDEREGKLPRDPSELRRLPGFGPYMAASVAALAFGRPVIPVDANVRRVGARLLALRPGTDPDRGVAVALAAAFDGGRPADVVNALMDLGATVCLPRDPQCGLCPLSRACRGRGSPLRYGAVVARKPVRRRVAVALASLRAGRVWLTQGRERLLEGMWDLPVAEAEDASAAREGLARSLAPRLARSLAGVAVAFRVRHTIMDRRIERHVLVSVATPVRPTVRGRFATLAEAERLPLTSTARRCLRELRGLDLL